MHNNGKWLGLDRRDFLKLTVGGAALGGLGALLPDVAEAAIPKTLIAKAKAEGRLNTIALPPDWANYGEIIKTFEHRYGIRIHNASPDASSAQELQAIRSLKGQSRGPDAVDVGPSFALIGASEGLFQPYKVSTWDTIPDDMKDPNGLWYGDYFGLVSFGVNRSVVKKPPKTWADLKRPEYKGMIALDGSPLGAGDAFGAVFGAALANGGSLDNIEPGIAFFAELAKLGNFTPVGATPASETSGQTPIVIKWDYLNLATAKKAKGMVQIDTLIPEGAPAFGNFYCQAISKYAPNPQAVRLWEEFLYSDEGQLLFLKGFAHPARYADMIQRDVIPQELMAQLPPAAPYKNVSFPDKAQSEKAQKALAENWTKEVKT